MNEETAQELLEALKNFVAAQKRCYGDGVKTHLAMMDCAAQAIAAIDKAEER